MEYELIQHLGKAIDDVYNNTAEDSSRRTIAKFLDEKLVIEYRTILSVAREQDMDLHIREAKREANQMLASRLKSIKECFKTCSGRSLKTKKVGDNDKSEILTVSAYSPVRMIKFSFCQTFEIS